MVSKSTNAFNWRESVSVLIKDKAINGSNINKNRQKLNLKNGLNTIDDSPIRQGHYYSMAKPSVFRSV